jgi:hypothetical protein
LLAEAEKSQRYIDYRDPTTARPMIDRVINGLSPAQKNELKYIVLSKY